MLAENPTKRAYGELMKAYDFFNTRLFASTLPRCLITMQRQNGARGYYSQERFGSFGARDGEEVTDEIAMNPRYFRSRAIEDTLSTLVHEMVHLWQFRFGNASRRAYHNREFATKMEAIGLITSDTGEPGGRRVGQRMTHYIAPGGPFAVACAELLRRGLTISFADREDGNSGRGKDPSKTRYTCPDCNANIWGKPNLHVVCGECDAPFKERVAA